MCMNCEASNVKRGVDIRRLSLVLGFGVTIGAGFIGILFFNPALVAVIPLFVLAAGCPAMCFAPKVSAWVKGDGRQGGPTQGEASHGVSGG